jgi:hypothetical protein
VTQVKTVTLTGIVEGSWKDTGVAALPGGSGFGCLVCRRYLGDSGLGCLVCRRYLGAAGLSTALNM